MHIYNIFTDKFTPHYHSEPVFPNVVEKVIVMLISFIIMDISLNKRLKLGTEGMPCCKLSQFRPILLRKDNYFKPLPVRK